MHEEHCAIQNLTRRHWNTSSFCAIKKAILGSSYSLSITLIGDIRARALSTTYRDKDTKSNVLSFPLSHSEGEIFLNLARITREAHRFSLSPEGHANYLLIHGCLHLKGYVHGGTMEKAEQTYLKKFDIH